MSDTPFQLTLAGFKESALKAIAEQRLAIQHEDLIEGDFQEHGLLDCANVYPPERFGGKTLNCIIGCTLPPHIAADYHEEDITSLVSYGVVDVPEPDLARLKAIQTSHDDLIQSYEPWRVRRWLQERDAFIQSIRDLEVPAEAA